MPSSLPPSWLHTPRLAVREFAAVDFDDLYRLDSDPRVMQYLNDGEPLSRAEVRSALASAIRDYPHYHGLGVWRAARREGDRFIGWCSLRYAAPHCEVELAYRLVPEAWGQGYATELARALVHYALADLGIVRVIGVTHPANAASQRVLQKSGLADEGLAPFHGREVRVFAADARRPHWRTAGPTPADADVLQPPPRRGEPGAPLRRRC